MVTRFGTACMMLVCLVATSCAPTVGHTRSELFPRPATRANDIQVLYSRPDRPFTVVGTVWLEDRYNLITTFDAAVPHLKKRAALLGGHAIAPLDSHPRLTGHAVSDIGAFPIYVTRLRAVVIVFE